MTPAECNELIEFLTVKRNEHDALVTTTKRTTKQARSFSLGYALGVQAAIEAITYMQSSGRPTGDRQPGYEFVHVV